MPESVFPLRDGRNLAYAEWGDPQGPAVLVFHGTPGSRLLGRGLVLSARLIVPDRPGYGLSDAKPGRSVYDFADDVAQLLGHLAIDACHVFGISGGCPYACATAHALGSRVVRGAVLSGIGPLDGKDATCGMEPMQARLIGIAKRHPRMLRALIAAQIALAPSDPEASVRGMVLTAPEEERRFALDTPGIMDSLVELQREGIRRVDGPLEDALAFVRPWGFPLGEIGTPMRFWHGEADRTAPLHLIRQMVGALPDARVSVIPGAGHFGTLRFLGEAMTYLGTGSEKGRGRRPG